MVRAASPVLLRIIILGAFFIYSTVSIVRQLVKNFIKVQRRKSFLLDHYFISNSKHRYVYHEDLAERNWICLGLRSPHVENMEVYTRVHCNIESLHRYALLQNICHIQGKVSQSRQNHRHGFDQTSGPHCGSFCSISSDQDLGVTASCYCW